eukprot:scaffold294037_cov14-Tisochrysis_lutea.AAC.1
MPEGFVEAVAEMPECCSPQAIYEVGCVDGSSAGEIHLSAGPCRNICHEQSNYSACKVEVRGKVALGCRSCACARPAVNTQLAASLRIERGRAIVHTGSGAA